MTLVQLETPPVYDETEMLRNLQDLYMGARDMKAQMATEWKRNYRVTMNRAAPNVPQAPGTRANEVFPTVDARVGWMTDQEIQFTFTPACDPFDPYSMVADTLCLQLEAVLNSVMHSNGWYSEIVKMLWDSAIYGAGFLKCVWDQGLEMGLGNVSLKSTSPWCLYVDPYATCLEDAEYIVEVHTMTAAQIERRFPDVGQSLDRRGRADRRHRLGPRPADPARQPPTPDRPHPHRRRPGSNNMGGARLGQASQVHRPGRQRLRVLVQGELRGGGNPR